MDIRELDNNNHSVFSMKFHLVMVIKYRKKVINDEISQRLKDIFEYIAVNYNITILEWNHDQDHIHVLLKGHPITCFTKFINAYKSASSRLIKKEYPNIKNQLYKDMFWSRSFCLISVGETNEGVIRQYIQKQGDRNEQ